MTSKQEYVQLSTDEKERLVKEFSEFKATKTIGSRVTACSKINDVTYTLNAIENEVCPYDTSCSHSQKYLL